MSRSVFSNAIFVIIAYLLSVSSYEHGDRLASQIQTSHKGWKTPWMDIPLHNMPRFRVSESSIVRVHLPHEENDKKTSEIGIDIKEDVKIAMSFASNKLAIPNIALFDSSERTSINKLFITFSHDHYKVLSVSYEIKYGPKIRKFDPTHPSLTAFEIVYQWESVQEVDFPFAISLMFTSSLAVMLCIGMMLWSFHPVEPQPPKKGRSEFSKSLRHR